MLSRFLLSFCRLLQRLPGLGDWLDVVGKRSLRLDFVEIYLFMISCFGGRIYRVIRQTGETKVNRYTKTRFRQSLSADILYWKDPFLWCNDMCTSQKRAIGFADCRWHRNIGQKRRFPTVPKSAHRWVEEWHLPPDLSVVYLCFCIGVMMPREKSWRWYSRW